MLIQLRAVPVDPGEETETGQPLQLHNQDGHAPEPQLLLSTATAFPSISP
ncbi:hypothetical protein SCP_1303840 [Sparassis crispa]|uniref:Uncharacterized protein n=1 Tax=Sparassis crispa TaxID=139825 RepID=A0A401H299_9APHY|nr:hypothetical protein SCP_1303840 [Sparassis crispa]GBE88567.1 hypothetical protein SCP_1303840 [Sparassis crispa]